MGRFFRFIVWVSVVLTSWAQDVNVTLVPAVVGFEADNTAFYYSSSPLLLANDGSAANGGFRVSEVKQEPQWIEVAHLKTGRSKITLPVYDIGGQDIFVTIAATDSIMKVFDATSFAEITDARKAILGDWSTLCSWRSPSSGNSYMFLFGKKMVIQLLVRDNEKRIKILEVYSAALKIRSRAYPSRFKHSLSQSKVNLVLCFSMVLFFSVLRINHYILLRLRNQPLLLGLRLHLKKYQHSVLQYITPALETIFSLSTLIH